MRSTALTRTRVIVGTVMAGATIATTGLATSLALAHTEQQADAATDAPSAAPAGTTDTPANTSHRGRKPTQPTTFTPTRPASPTSAPSHTKSKGS